MQNIITNFAEKHEIPNQAPGIYKVLGAVFLDIVLMVFFWFCLMSAGFAVWTLHAMFANGFHAVNTKPDQAALMLISMPALYLAIVILSLWRGRKLVLARSTITTARQIGLAVTTGFGLFLFTVLCTAVLNAAGLALKPANQALLEESGKQWPIVITFFAVVVAPFFEEIFFRKQLFARLAGAGYLVTGYFLSSLLFALMHEPAPTQGFARWFLMLALYGSMGAVFAWVYKKTGRLWPAMLAHATNNGIAMLALLLS